MPQCQKNYFERQFDVDLFGRPVDPCLWESAVMEDVYETLKNYVVSLEKLSILWETSGKRVSKPLIAIENYSDQLQAVSSINNEVALQTKFSDLEGRLTYSTLMCLEQELLTIIQIGNDICHSTEELNDLAVQLDHKLGSADSSSSSVSYHSLLEAVSDCRQYYQARSSSLQISIKCLDYRNWCSIKDLRKSFCEDKSQKSHLEKCMLLLKCFSSEVLL